MKTFFSALFLLFCSAVTVQAADISASANRTSGVAPFVVHFNADLWESRETERRFHDYHYEWNFGDPGSGNWGTDTKSRNNAKGPVAAHIYETPGTYTATLTAVDTGGISSTKIFEITVADPDIVFSGENTICISDAASNDFSGCPTGAQKIATDNLADMSSWVSDGRRVLLRRGSSWNTATQLVGDTHVTQAQIGAYGTCNSPDANGICANAPQISSTADTSSVISLHYKHDLVIHDISFSAAKFTNVGGSVVGGSVYLDNILLLRNKVRGFYTCLGWFHGQREQYQTWPENMAVISNDVRDFRGNALFAGGENIAVMGNRFHNSDITHVTRLWWTYKGIYAHNMVSGSSLTNTAGRGALKLHGPKSTDSQALEEFPHKTKEVGTYSEVGDKALPYSTQYVVISDNVFGSSGPWPVTIRPQDNFSDERIHDLIFERNRMVQDFGDHSSVAWNNPLRLNGYYLTVRNNIIDASYKDTSQNGIWPIFLESFDFMPPARGVRIYNNTVFNKGDAFVNRVSAVTISSAYSDVDIRNNYFVFTDAVPEIRIDDQSGDSTFSNNIYSKISYFSDPDNTDPLLRDFSLTSQSTDAIDTGYNLASVYEDYAGNLREGAFDIGAYNYDSGASAVLIRADVDQNGSIDSSDAGLTLRKALNMNMNGTAWRSSSTTGDVNCDGKTNATDALLILRHTLGLDMSGTGWCG